MGSGGSVTAMLEALERYLSGGEGTPAHAYVAGWQDGYAARPLRTRSTTRPTPSPVGFISSPLNKPPISPSPIDLCTEESGSVPLRSLVDPDLRSTGRANFGRGNTLELFPPPPEPPPTRRRRFPEEFRLTPALRRFAEAGGLDAGYEFAAFRDHYRATGELRADWPATFRTWCRRSLEFHDRRARR